MVTLTLELIHDCKTERGGFTSATVHALGLDMKEMTTGWPRRLVGRNITEESYQTALAGKFKAKGRRKYNPAQLVACFAELGPAPDKGTPAPGGW